MSVDKSEECLHIEKSELLRMAKVRAIVEVPYTQTIAWVMAALAKVVGQVNG